MSAPKRIQRRRTKGWRMPEGAVYVGRPSRWGNPFRATLPNPIDSFRRDLLDGLLPFTVVDVRRELRGKDLACWCPEDASCHADVLLEIANGPDPYAAYRRLERMLPGIRRDP